MTYVPTERRPTGIPAAPLFLVTGFPKTGKSLTTYKLALSPRIHKMWVIDIGEGSADEYGGEDTDPPYTILEWGDSFVDLKDTVKWACAQRPPEGKLTAVVIDSGNDLWASLSERANTRARNSKKSRELLASDPLADIETGMTYWNEAKVDWARIINPLKLTGHVVGVVIGRTEIVSVVDKNGRPTKEKTTSFGVEKTLQGIVTAHVSVDVNHRSRLIEVRSKRISVPADGLLLGDNPLAEVLELMSPAGGFAAPVARRPRDDGSDDPEMIERIKELFAKVKASAGTPLQKILQAASAEQGKGLKEADLTDVDWFVEVRSLIDNYAAPEGVIDPPPIDPLGDN